VSSLSVSFLLVSVVVTESSCLESWKKFKWISRFHCLWFVFLLYTMCWLAQRLPFPSHYADDEHEWLIRPKQRAQPRPSLFARNWSRTCFMFCWTRRYYWLFSGITAQRQKRKRRSLPRKGPTLQFCVTRSLGIFFSKHVYCSKDKLLPPSRCGESIELVEFIGPNITQFHEN